MNVAPTVAHCVSLPAPRGGRVWQNPKSTPWGGPAVKPVTHAISHRPLEVSLLASVFVVAACGALPLTRRVFS